MASPRLEAWNPVDASEASSSARPRLASSKSAPAILVKRLSSRRSDGFSRMERTSSRASAMARAGTRPPPGAAPIDLCTSKQALQTHQVGHGSSTLVWCLYIVPASSLISSLSDLLCWARVMFAICQIQKKNVSYIFALILMWDISVVASTVNS